MSVATNGKETDFMPHRLNKVRDSDSTGMHSNLLDTQSDVDYALLKALGHSYATKGGTALDMIANH